MVEHVGLAWSRCDRSCGPRARLEEEKKLSIAALSQTLPERLKLQVTPCSAISRWNASLVYWLPRSE